MIVCLDCIYTQLSIVTVKLNTPKSLSENIISLSLCTSFYHGGSENGDVGRDTDKSTNPKFNTTLSLFFSDRVTFLPEGIIVGF